MKHDFDPTTMTCVRCFLPLAELVEGGQFICAPEDQTVVSFLLAKRRLSQKFNQRKDMTDGQDLTA